MRTSLTKPVRRSLVPFSMAKKQTSPDRGAPKHFSNRDTKDFTGGGILALPRKPGSTGDGAVDQAVHELVQKWDCGESNSLIEEMIITALLMGKDGIDDADLKLYNRALKEYRSSSRMFGPYAATRKVSIFGSARTKPDQPEYKTALEFARKMAEVGFMGITGAGPGIMGAAQAGSGRENSFGLGIALPFEGGANETIEGDHKLINFNYFFTRKLAFVKESDATAVFPGGFGTMDEIFEVLTLMQTGKATIFPIVMIDAPGGTYWKTWVQFVREQLHRLGLISEEDFNLFLVAEDVDAAVEEITRFYKNFHSYRYVGKECVLRLQNPVSEKMLMILNQEFRDLLEKGEFTACAAFKQERAEPELAHLHRLKFTNKRGRAGRLRKLIDQVNEF
jgi:uncharacterized protein (TIGR00730 family)